LRGRGIRGATALTAASRGRAELLAAAPVAKSNYDNRTLREPAGAHTDDWPDIVGRAIGALAAIAIGVSA
jgi:hypothetical protein